MENKEKKNIHANHRDRMRQKFSVSGFSGMAEHEVLEMLLYGIYSRKDTNKIAHDLINECGGFYGVFNTPASKLMAVDGVGKAAAQYIHMLRDFVRYYSEKRMSLESFDINKKATREFMHELFAEQNRELIFLICLNSKNKVVKYKMVAEGDFESVQLNVSLIAKTAVECDAPKIIMAHNHPSGSIIASNADRTSTYRLMEAVGMLGISMVDHFIVTDDCISSVLDRKKVFNR